LLESVLPAPSLIKQAWHGNTGTNVNNSNAVPMTEGMVVHV